MACSLDRPPKTTATRGLRVRGACDGSSCGAARGRPWWIDPTRADCGRLVGWRHVRPREASPPSRHRRRHRGPPAARGRQPAERRRSRWPRRTSRAATWSTAATATRRGRRSRTRSVRSRAAAAWRSRAAWPPSSTLLDLVGQGSKVVAPRHAYNGSVGQLADLEARGRVKAVLVDVTDPEAFVKACEDAALVWLESPTNPALEVVDIPAIVAAAHEAGAYVVVDNTFATPLLQQPLALGADLVLHSATKFIAGHSDVLMGAVVTAADELHRRAQEPPRHGRQHSRAVRGLARAARAAHVARAPGARPGQRPGARAPARGAPGDRRGPLPRLRRDRRCRAGRGGAGRRPADPHDVAVGARDQPGRASSRPSSGGAAGSPSRPRSPTGWCGCRWASRTSRTCGTTWRRRWTTWREHDQSRSCLACLEISAVSMSAAVISPSTTECTASTIGA